jgi:hypothetical protein
MKKEYFTEEIVKGDGDRSAYVNGIQRFLQNEYAQAERRRADFISPETYQKAPETFRKRFVDMLGFPLDRRNDETLAYSKRFVASDQGVNIYRVTITGLGKIPCYGIYFEPIKKAVDCPFVLAIHGGQGTPEVIGSIHLYSANYAHAARRLADKGIAVFAPQLLLWNQAHYGNAYDRPIIDGRLRQLGGSITALEVALLSQGIDCFIKHENINDKKIGAVGLSYGGMFSLFLAAYDTRIKSCFSCSQFNDRFRYSWSGWSYLNAADRFGDAEIAALICPRGLVIAVGDHDELFDCDSAVQEHRRVIPYYEKYDAADKYLFYVFEGKHEFDKSDKGLDFFMARLGD